MKQGAKSVQQLILNGFKSFFLKIAQLLHLQNIRPTTNNRFVHCRTAQIKMAMELGLVSFAQRLSSIAGQALHQPLANHTRFRARKSKYISRSTNGRWNRRPARRRTRTTTRSGTRTLTRSRTRPLTRF